MPRHEHNNDEEPKKRSKGNLLTRKKALSNEMNISCMRVATKRDVQSRVAAKTLSCTLFFH